MEENMIKKIYMNIKEEKFLEKNIMIMVILDLRANIYMVIL